MHLPVSLRFPIRSFDQFVRRRQRYGWTFLCAAILVIAATEAFAQPDSSAAPPPFRFGAFGGIGPTFLFSSLSIPGFEDCTDFDGGAGSRLAFGGLFELPSAAGLTLQARLGLLLEKGELTREFDAGPVLGTGGVGQARAIIRNVLSVTRSSLDLGVGVLYPVSGRFGLRLGLDLARTLGLDETYTQVAVAPDDLLFAEGKREQRIMSGEIHAPAPLSLGATAGASYDVPISRASLLSPEISFSLPITGELSDGSLRSASLTFGLALRFGFPAERAPDSVKPPDPIVPPDTPIVGNPVLRPVMTTDPDTVRVTIRESDSIEYLPLLNQVYFAHNSYELEGRYKRIATGEREYFGYDQLVGSALDVYRHILNIIGYRMTRYPDAKLTLTGYRNGRESDRELTKRRAESIRDYIVNVWEISPRRISVRGGGMPPNASRETVVEGFEENSRVEISSDEPNITGPVVRRHTRRDANPPAITFYPKVETEAGLKEWLLEVKESRRPWKAFRGGSALPDSIVWNWRSDSGDLPTLPMRLAYRLLVRDSAGQQATIVPRDVDVRYTSRRDTGVVFENDSLVETYSLLLFNFDSRKVSEADNHLLRAISSNIKAGALLRFTGYTDSLGESSYNRDLANARAREAARIFRTYIPRNVMLIVSDEGGERQRFPYSTPEGRAHCRTVIIEVRTPIKEEGS